MEEMIFDEAFIEQLERVQMGIALRLHEGLQGGRRSSAKGSSLEFSDFREYEPGDDFRRIDWTAYGRLDKLFIKVFMEEKEAVFNLFLDQSKSMAFGNPTKGKKSLQIVAALSYIVMKHQDKVNIRLLGDNISRDEQSEANQKLKHREETEHQLSEQENGNILRRKITPRAGKQGFHELLSKLQTVQFNGRTDIGEQILKEPIKGKGVSVIVSDFLFSQGLQTLEKSLAYLSYKKQQVILIQVLCKEERDPEETGDFELVDSETNKSVRVTLNPKWLEAYKERFKAYQVTLQNLAQKYGAKFITVSAEESIEEIILKDFYHQQIII